MDISVINNFKREVFSLYLIQISNILFPFITFIYVANIVGMEGLGKLSFYQTIGMLIAFFVDFGFSMSASKTLSLNLNDRKVLNIIYSNVQLPKYVLWIFFSLVFIIFAQFFNLSDDDLKIFYISTFSGLASVLTCSWVFQGLTKNSVLAFLVLVFKIISTLLIILFVKSNKDIINAIFIQFLASFLVGILSIYYIRSKYQILFKFSFLNIGQIKSLFSESYHNFIASFFTLGFTYLNPLLVKGFFGDVGLGIYASAEKIVNILRQAFTPISQTFYAEMCKLSNEKNYRPIIEKNKKIFIFFSVICLIALVSNLFLGQYIYPIFFGESVNVRSLVLLIAIMIINQWIISLAIIFVNLMIIPFGESKILKRFYFFGLLIHIIFVYPLLKFFAINGIVISLIITESFLTFSFYIYIKKFLKKESYLY